MRPSRKTRWAAGLAIGAIAAGALGIGATYAAFTGQTDAAGNRVTAAPDFRGPTISPVAIGKSSGGTTGFIGSNRTYYVYANVTDPGTPPSGVNVVTADVSNVTTGQVAVALVPGSYSVGGQSFNYRSVQLTSNFGLPSGPRSFTVSATDLALNATTASGSVTIDSTAPTATNIQASGGIAGRPEAGDVMTLTTSDTLDPFTLYSAWGGSSTEVLVRIRDNAAGDRLEVWDPGFDTQYAFGTISLGRTDFTGGTIWFQGSTIVQSGNAIAITLGSSIFGTVTTVGGSGTMVWTPSSTARDRAGNAMSTTALNEPGSFDRDF